jgi:hypothetical protein
MRNMCHILVGKPEGERPFGRPSHRRENNIEIDLKETGREDVNWVALAQDIVQWWAPVNTALRV